MTVELAGDLSLAVLLVLTLVWCILLLRKLRRINLDRRDVADLVAGIDAATRRAEAAIAGIREAAREAQLVLGKERERIDARVGKLAKLAEGGSQIARRLDDLLQGGARSVAELQVGRGNGRVDRRAPGAFPAVAKTGTVPVGRASPSAPGERTDPSAKGALLKTLEGLR